MYTTVYTAVYKPCTQIGLIHDRATALYALFAGRVHGCYTAVYGPRTLNNCYIQLSNRLIVTENRNNIEIFLYI